MQRCRLWSYAHINLGAEIHTTSMFHKLNHPYFLVLNSGISSQFCILRRFLVMLFKNVVSVYTCTQEFFKVLPEPQLKLTRGSRGSWYLAKLTLFLSQPSMTTGPTVNFTEMCFRCRNCIQSINIFMPLNTLLH